VQWRCRYVKGAAWRREAFAVADILWVTKDCLDREVELSERTWTTHAAKRQYMAAYFDQVKETVENPDTCMRDDTGVRHYYKLGVLKDKYSGTYLRVVALPLGANRLKVVSFWASKEIDPGYIEWLQKKN
jgi:hypothetical protein